jgi:hypothetical protein
LCRVHEDPGVTSVLAVPEFFSHFALSEGRKRDEYDTDISLEFEESDVENAYRYEVENMEIALHTVM